MRRTAQRRSPSPIRASTSYPRVAPVYLRGSLLDSAGLRVEPNRLRDGRQLRPGDLPPAGTIGRPGSLSRARDELGDVGHVRHLLEAPDEVDERPRLRHLD